MKFAIYFSLLILFITFSLTGCAGGIEGHRWSAEYVSNIHKGMSRNEVLSMLGKPYQTTTDNYSSDKKPTRHYDYWRHDGSNIITGGHTQEHIYVYYDKNFNVTSVNYNRAR